ncbi:MAG: PHP domain-containing protein [Ardenticatenia bacterium]|nr:PHP domain-containing protein [Ardenticatenia bacterium]
MLPFMKIDLHLHTFRSPDSLTTYEQVIRAVQQRGLDAVAVTDHNTIRGALELREIAPFPVIVGEEIRTQEGEVIGYFLEEEIPPGLGLDETIDRIREQGGLVAIPHPVDRARKGSALGLEATLRVLDRVDFVEGWNARCLFLEDNVRAQVLARQHNKPMTAGSDAHGWREIGLAYVQVDTFDAPRTFLAHMAKATITGQWTPLHLRLASPWARVMRAVLRRRPMG